MNGHTWIGVFLSVGLYLVCLSGTLAVFYQEFERWEQPEITEMQDVSPDVVERAMGQFMAAHPQETDHFYVVFPTSGIPRLVVENDHAAYFADQEGNLIDEENVKFTNMLVDLHLYLNLPASWGMILVGALGAMICGLVITGIIAHKRISKDAFKLRRKGSGQQAQTDLHNRIGLWAAPFHLIIGVTGAYFGMAGVLLTLVSQLYFDGDRDAATAQIFTPDPVLEQTIDVPDIKKAVDQMATLAPDHQPIFLAVHEVNSSDQFIEIFAKVPGKLIYSENYRFDTKGNYLGTAGYENGNWGKQAVYAMYRLHFGDFAGIPSKLLYFVLGIMLTVLCISGVEIWLAKKANPPVLSRLWAATVWGSIAALAITAIVDLFTTLPLVAVFWLLLALCCICAMTLPTMTKPRWQQLSGVSVIALLACYTLYHGSDAFNLPALQINLLLLGFAGWVMWRGHTLLKRQR
nr:PepSY-associated TM helix domain-containing protein [Alteromonas sp. C1M14]